MSDESFIYVRNTVSGITEALTPEDAASILAHPWFSKTHIRVDGPQNEVLSAPYRVDEDGARVYVDDNFNDLPDAKQQKAQADAEKAEAEAAKAAAEPDPKPATKNEEKS